MDRDVFQNQLGSQQDREVPWGLARQGMAGREARRRLMKIDDESGLTRSSTQTAGSSDQGKRSMGRRCMKNGPLTRTGSPLE